MKEDTMGVLSFSQPMTNIADQPMIQATLPARVRSWDPIDFAPLMQVRHMVPQCWPNQGHLKLVLRSPVASPMDFPQTKCEKIGVARDRSQNLIRKGS